MASARAQHAAGLAAIAAVFVAGAWMLLGLAPNWDNAWLQVAARRVFVDGRSFVTDAFEVNPPMAIAIFAPSAWIERWTGWDADRVYQMLSLAVAAAGAVAMRGPLAWLFGASARAAAVAATALAVEVFGATTLFGERDAMTLVLSLPFLVWWCARLAGRPAPTSAGSLLAAAVAALGVLLKPTVAFVPAAMLACWWWPRRNLRALFEPHFALMLAIAAAYGLALVTVLDGWLPVGQLGVRAYWAYTVPFIRTLRAGAPDYLHALLPLALACAMPAQSRLRAFLLPLALAAVAFQMSMLLQMKAFVYHALPGRQLASIACAIALAGWLDAGDRRGPGPLPVVLAGDRRGPGLLPVVLAMIGLLYAPLCGGLLVGFPRPQSSVAGLTNEGLRATPLFRHLERAAQYGPFVVLSTSLVPVWPAAGMVGAEWASRGPCDLIAAAVMQLEEGGEGERAEAASLREIAAGFLADDLARWQPPVVVVRTDAPESPRSPGNLIAFYGSDARVVDAWKAYRFETRDENWEYWVRRGSLADRAGAVDF